MPTGQETILLDEGVLEWSRRQLPDDHPSLPAYDRLLEEAAAALERGPYSVTDKAERPPSEDPHDYLSQGPYWWPNPDTADGLPYVRQDGVKNPEVEDLDYPQLRDMATDVNTLALAAHFARDDRYAERAADLIRIWFLEEGTKMNPHLRFGQRVPGRVSGRGIGIIETRHLRYVIDAILILARLGAIGEDELERLRGWFGEYVQWLLHSDHGRSEAAHWNNHGSWYDAQVTAFLLFSGNREVARTLLETAHLGERRIAAQIVRGGSQPNELARTRPMHYCVHNLTALMGLARIAEHVDVDLWGFETYDRGIRPAVEWIADRVEADDIPQPDPDAVPLDRGRLHDLLIRAGAQYDDPRYVRLAGALDGVDADRRVIHLLVRQR